MLAYYYPQGKPQCIDGLIRRIVTKFGRCMSGHGEVLGEGLPRRRGLSMSPCLRKRTTINWASLSPLSHSPLSQTHTHTLTLTYTHSHSHSHSHSHIHIHIHIHIHT